MSLRGRVMTIASVAGAALAAGLSMPAAAGAGAAGWLSAPPAGQATSASNGATINVVHCPSPDLCVAVDSIGNVLTSSGPSATTWSAAKVVNGSIQGLGCPSTHLCVLGTEAGGLFASRNPAGGGGTWHRVYLDPAKPGMPAPGSVIQSLTCPSVRLCLASDTYGNVISSTDPARRGAWRKRFVIHDLYHGLGGVGGLTCPGIHFCAGLDPANKVWTTSNPRGGRHAWHAQTFPITGGNNNTLLSISCPARSFCVLLDWFTKVQPNAVVALVSHTPETGGWRRAGRLLVDGGPGVGLYCRSVTLCVAFGQSGVPSNIEYFVDSTSTPGSTRTWGQTTVGHPISNAACPALNDCVLVTGDGFSGYSAQPLDGDWSFTQIDTAPSSG